MFSIITKAEYFDWVDRKYCTLDRQELKNVQDGLALANLSSFRNKRILEAGGGNSRVLPRLDASCELWNADKFEGDGNGPVAMVENPRIKIVRSFVGDFSADLPDDYFDAIFSVSVVEHIPGDALGAFVDDSIRILKTGGVAIHAVDLAIGDASMLDRPQFKNQNARIQMHKDLIDARRDRVGWIEPPTLVLPAIASAAYAANSNNTLYRWAKKFPARRAHREISQSVSLKWGFVKTR